MTSNRSSPRLMFTAMACAGAVTAQFVGGKATRDALFLGSLNYTALPAMVIATSASSILFVALNSAAARKAAPATLIPAYFAGSGLLFIAEWLLTFRAPAVAAVIVYLHISGAGPVLGSGFWLIASERFDPRTAKRHFGQIAGAGTIGGLLSAILAERVAALLGAAAMLPFLGAFHVLSAWQVRQLAVPSDAAPPKPGRIGAPAPETQSGVRVLLGSPYLRRLAAVVLLGTASAALLDYLFKAEAVRTVGRGENLLRLFAVFYASTSVLTFVVQTSASRFVLERFGLAVTTSAPSLALIAGGIGGLIAPGFQGVMIARAGESVFRGSLFRTGYELFYTPVPATEKRAAKSIIDVGFDRMGDAVGGGLIRIAMVLVPAASQYPAVLSLAILCSVAALLAASRLNRGYIQTLEKSLLNRAVEIDLSDIEDGTTRTLVLRTLKRPNADFAFTRADDAESPAPSVATTAFAHDPELQDVLWLRTRNRDRIVDVLRREEGLSALLVTRVIPLLAWDAVAPDAVFALRKVAEERVGQLIDALIDPNQDFVIRRRLARVFSVCVSQRAADGLMLGLDDLRFEVRFQCGHSLAAILAKNPRVQIDRERIFDFVRRETEVGRPVWESRRLLDEVQVWEGVPMVDEFVRDRASQSLAHVFTLLSLVLPREPLQIAFRSLHTDDEYLQGTALEYMESVLPPTIRQPLWPYLEDRRPIARRPTRPHDEVLADLLRSNQSVLINLEELKRRAVAADRQSGGQLPAPIPRARRPQRMSKAMAEKRILEPRVRTEVRGASTGTTTGRLPDDLLDEQNQRFGIFTAVGAGLWTFGLVMHTVIVPRTLGPTVPWSSVAVDICAILASVAAFLYVRYAGQCAQTKSEAGLWYMLLNAIAVALLNAQRLAKVDTMHIGTMEQLSWNTIVILVSSMFTPTTPRKMFGASMAAASMDPLALWIAHLGGAQVPSALNTLVLFMPNYACAIVATVPAYAMRRIGHRLREAQELGSYQLIELLGRGGMGEVWRAKHRLLARPAAIKLVRPEVLGASTDAEARTLLRRFEREAQATAALSSPHTIRIFDFGATHDGAFYYVMELLCGRDLASLVQEFGPLPADRTLYLLRQVCHSLADAHARGMVHRDIKPANIYVCRMGLEYDFVKVLDFGLVKVSAKESLDQTLTAEHTTSGTPAFMAPEIILGERDIDQCADVYALGCVAYYLLTGELVFDADTPMKVLLHHVQTPPVPPSQRTELPIPKELDEIVLACLEKDPRKRPQDALQLFRMARDCRTCESWDSDAAKRWWEMHLLELTGPLTLIEAPPGGASPVVTH